MVVVTAFVVGVSEGAVVGTIVGVGTVVGADGPGGVVGGRVFGTPTLTRMLARDVCPLLDPLTTKVKFFATNVGLIEMLSSDELDDVRSGLVFERTVTPLGTPPTPR